MPTVRIKSPLVTVSETVAEETYNTDRLTVLAEFGITVYSGVSIDTVDITTDQATIDAILSDPRFTVIEP